jgi:hypothetical protein
MDIIVKNKPLFHKANRRVIIITSAVPYEGLNKTKIYYTEGYGASETRSDVLLDDQQLKEWLSQWEDRKPIGAKSKPELNKELTPNPIVMEDKNEGSLSEIKCVLFDTINKVRSKTMDVEQAKCIAGLCQTYLNAEKVVLQSKK